MPARCCFFSVLLLKELNELFSTNQYLSAVYHCLLLSGIFLLPPPPSPPNFAAAAALEITNSSAAAWSGWCEKVALLEIVKQQLVVDMMIGFTLLSLSKLSCSFSLPHRVLRSIESTTTAVQQYYYSQSHTTTTRHKQWVKYEVQLSNSSRTYMVLLPHRSLTTYYLLFSSIPSSSCDTI